tara:strand:- start:2090 stop:3457 length:1368 start_codon:yes stop_codon:yes gene_type:complete
MFFSRFLVFLIKAIIFLSCTMIIASKSRAQTLEEALISAYKTNPTILSQRASLRATDEQIPQAKAGWRPSVTLSSSLSLNHVAGNQTGSTDTKPRSWTLSISQPIYRGGRTINGISQARDSILAARAGLDQTEQSVLQSAVRAYMDVLRDEAVVELSLANEARLRRQSEATKDRFEVGEVTKTDVAQADARLSSVVSSRVAAEGTLGVSRAIFRRVTGLDAGNLSRVPSLDGFPSSIQEAIEIGLKNNPSIVQAQNIANSAKTAIEVAKGTLRPNVSLSASYTSSYNSSALNYISDTAQVTAQISMPLYQAGSVSSQVRQAKQLASQRKMQLELQRQSVIESVTSAWSGLKSATDRIRSTIDQVEAAEIALDGVIQESNVGARTTLDVLDAEQELLDAQVALVRAERDEFVAGFDLLLSIGMLSPKDLGLPIKFYDPDDNLNRVRNIIYGHSISD